jgi:WD40 repeat protein
MRPIKLFFLLFGIFCLLTASCNPSIIISSPTNQPTTTTTILPTDPPVAETAIPTKTITCELVTNSAPTSINDEPALLTIIGENYPQTEYFGYPVFSPDSQVLALSGSTVSLWNTKTFELIREFETQSEAEDCYGYDATFSPDSKLFATSDNCDATGYVRIWDVSTGELLHEWEREFASMPPTSTSSWEYFIPVGSMAFIPNSTKIVYASGNSLEIRDVYNENDHSVLNLGPEMYASQISLSSDGRLVYIIMSWMKDHDFPSAWTTQNKFQIWNINTHTMLREVKYPEGWVNLSLELLGTSLVEVNFEEGTSQIINLETDEIKKLPYRQGWRYYSPDGSLIIYARLFGFDEQERIIELWQTNNWQKIYTFMPNNDPSWSYGLTEIVFSHDNTVLAINHQGTVMLWNIRPVVQP